MSLWFIVLDDVTFDKMVSSNWFTHMLVVIIYLLICVIFVFLTQLKVYIGVNHFLCSVDFLLFFRSYAPCFSDLSFFITIARLYVGLFSKSWSHIVGFGSLISPYFIFFYDVFGSSFRITFALFNILFFLYIMFPLLLHVVDSPSPCGGAYFYWKTNPSSCDDSPHSLPFF